MEKGGLRSGHFCAKNASYRNFQFKKIENSDQSSKMLNNDMFIN